MIKLIICKGQSVVLGQWNQGDWLDIFLKWVSFPPFMPQRRIWGVEIQVQSFLISALEGADWSVSRSTCFTPTGSPPVSLWIVGWVGPAIHLDAWDKSLSCPDRNLTTFPWSSVWQPSFYTNCPSLALIKKEKQEITKIFGVNTSGILLRSTPRMRYKNYLKNVMDLVCVGGCNAMLTLREERRLRVFDNKVLRRIFGPRRDEVTGDWRRR